MTMFSEEKRKEILRKLAAGELDIAEADRLMEQVEFDEDSGEDAPVPYAPKTGQTDPVPTNDDPATDSPIPPEFRKFKWVWVWFLCSGILFTLLGGFGMYNGYEAARLGWGFWLSWIPLLVGVAIITLALATSHSIWVHVRISTGQNEWPRRIAISLPLPMFLLRFGMRMGKLELDGIGKFGSDDLDALLKAIHESDVPLTVHVREDSGEKVEVYIGK